MPAVIHPKNLFIVLSLPHIGCMEELDADAIGGVLPKLVVGRASARAKESPYMQRISHLILLDRPRKAIAQGRC
jgi:hypothetical protein